MDRKSSVGESQFIRQPPSELDPSKYAPGKNHFRKRNHSIAVSATNKKLGEQERENLVTPLPKLFNTGSKKAFLMTPQVASLAPVPENRSQAALAQKK